MGAASRVEGAALIPRGQAPCRGGGGSWLGGRWGLLWACSMATIGAPALWLSGSPFFDSPGVRVRTEGDPQQHCDVGCTSVHTPLLG